MDTIERQRLLRVRDKIIEFARPKVRPRNFSEECVIDILEVFPSPFGESDDNNNISAELYSTAFNKDRIELAHIFLGDTYSDVITKMEEWIDKIIRDGIPNEEDDFYDDDDE